MTSGSVLARPPERSVSLHQMLTPEVKERRARRGPMARLAEPVDRVGLRVGCSEVAARGRRKADFSHSHLRRAG